MTDDKEDDETIYKILFPLMLLVAASFSAYLLNLGYTKNDPSYYVMGAFMGFVSYCMVRVISIVYKTK